MLPPVLYSIKCQFYNNMQFLCLERKKKYFMFSRCELFHFFFKYNFHLLTFTLFPTLLNNSVLLSMLSFRRSTMLVTSPCCVPNRVAEGSDGRAASSSVWTASSSGATKVAATSTNSPQSERTFIHIDVVFLARQSF